MEIAETPLGCYASCIRKLYAPFSFEAAVQMLLPRNGFYFHSGLDFASAQATRMWTGAVSTDWFNPTNWSPNGVPAGNDTVRKACRGYILILFLDVFMKRLHIWCIPCPTKFCNIAFCPLKRCKS
jgi:hypothetical protein